MEEQRCEECSRIKWSYWWNSDELIPEPDPPAPNALSPWAFVYSGSVSASCPQGLKIICISNISTRAADHRASRRAPLAPSSPWLALPLEMAAEWAGSVVSTRMQPWSLCQCCFCLISGCSAPLAQAIILPLALLIGIIRKSLLLSFLANPWAQINTEIRVIYFRGAQDYKHMGTDHGLYWTSEVDSLCRDLLESNSHFCFI